MWLRAETANEKLKQDALTHLFLIASKTGSIT